MAEEEQKNESEKIKAYDNLRTEIEEEDNETIL